MPACTAPCTWRMAASVTLLAICMSASSAGDLMMRQARTTSSPAITSRLPPAARVTRSTIKKRVVGSTARLPVAPACARKASASRSKGLASSFHGRTSPATLSVSRIEGSSKNGVTMTTGPRAGMRAAVVLSDLHQRMPVKYSSVEPASTSRAALLRCCSRDCSFSRRAPCSCALIGCAAAVNDCKPPAGLWAALTTPAPATAAPAAAPPTKARLETLVMDSPLAGMIVPPAQCALAATHRCR